MKWIKLFNESNGNDYFKEISSSDYLNLFHNKKHENWTKEDLEFIKKSVLDLTSELNRLYNTNFEVYEIFYGGQWKQNNRKYTSKKDLLNNTLDSKKLENFLKHNMIASGVEINLYNFSKNKQKRINFQFFVTKREDEWFLTRVFRSDTKRLIYNWFYECDQIEGFIELLKKLISEK